jgi:hypothetical protein
MTDRNDEPEAQPSGVFPSSRRGDMAAEERVEPLEVLDRLQALQVRAWRGIASNGPTSRASGSAWRPSKSSSPGWNAARGRSDASRDPRRRPDHVVPARPGRRTYS